ncbi:MAG TPA: hypothetical protein VFW03_05390 [Gemmatimonadaceae bacterium]|nr:hypothetical protein [Gemmatimonadaceae bacterium]
MIRARMLRSPGERQTAGSFLVRPAGSRAPEGPLCLTTHRTYL